MKHDINTTYAFTHATIYTAYNTKIENATLIIKGDKILNVGVGIVSPKEAVEINCTGKIIYPAFVDAFTKAMIDEIKKAQQK